jgi:2-methylisocitrate lyase-like PEP mutase family enzyme
MSKRYRPPVDEPTPVTDRFRALHRPGDPLLLPNPWDAGSARILASMGFRALATTSSGHAASLGRLDGSVDRDEALAHAATIVAATDLPVSADLENGFGDDPAEVARTVAAAAEAGLAGCSIEDASRHRDDPIYDLRLAAERVHAAVEAAHSSGRGLVLTARAEGYLYGRVDLDDTITRLRAFQDAGADVLYAPGLIGIDDIRTLVHEVGRPVNVLAVPGGPSVPELAAAGVARVSVGGAFAYAALGALVDAGRELLAHGTYGFWSGAERGREAARAAFRRDEV